MLARVGLPETLVPVCDPSLRKREQSKRVELDRCRYIIVSEGGGEIPALHSAAGSAGRRFLKSPTGIYTMPSMRSSTSW